MANFFYTDADGNRQGPVSEQRLKELVAQRVIMPMTLLETDGGHKGVARQIPGLNFPTDEIGLFDIGFTRFFTNIYISYIWILTIILTLLSYVVCLGFLFSIAGYNLGPPGTVFVLFIVLTILVPISLLVERMSLEAIIVFFRIETHLRAIREKYEKG